MPAPRHDPQEMVPHWASVLYLGVSVPEDLPRSAPLAVALSAADCARAVAVDHHQNASIDLRHDDMATRSKPDEIAQVS